MPIRTLASLAALALALLLAAYEPWRPQESTREVLRGRALELTDSRGTVRARIDVEPGGEVVLRLLDERGTIRVKLGAGEDGSGLVLNNERTEPGIHLVAGSQGSRIRVVDGNRERVVTATDDR